MNYISKTRENLFKLRFKYKEGNVVTEKLKDTGNGKYGQTIRRDIDYERKCVNKKWMERKYDNTV